jgi:hypothetical protein
LVKFPIHTLNNFNWRGKYVAFTYSARLHLEEFQINAIELIDMLHNPVPCPKNRIFRKKDIEICSMKKGRIFRIILFEDYCIDVQADCWVVKHVKPI